MKMKRTKILLCVLMIICVCSCNTGHQIHIPDKNEDFLVEILKNGKWKEIPVQKYGQNLDGITFRNISYTGKRATAARVHGLDEKHTISNVLIDNFTVNGKKVDAEDNEYISINKYVDNIEVK